MPLIFTIPNFFAVATLAVVLVCLGLAALIFVFVARNYFCSRDTLNATPTLPHSGISQAPAIIRPHLSSNLPTPQPLPVAPALESASQTHDSFTPQHHRSFLDEGPLASHTTTLNTELPQFWSFNPAGYFHSIELIFSMNNITLEITKYCLLIQALGKTTNVLQKVSDVIRTVDAVTPYSTLKSALIQRYATQSSGCLQTILNGCYRGNKTVSEFLIELQALLGEHYDSTSPLHRDLIKHKLLESLDPQMRLCLYHYEDGPLDTLAKHADRLLSRHVKTPGSSPNSTSLDFDNTIPTPNQKLINEVVESRLDKLQDKVAFMSRSWSSASGTPPHGGVGMRPTFTPPPRFNVPPCFYHSRFGNRARRCEGLGCPLYAPQQTTPHQKNEKSISTA